MDRALQASLAQKPNIKGTLFADANGLLISATGELTGSKAGRFASIAHQAASIHPDQAPPTVVIETRNRKVLVKDYDSMTIALRCTKQD